MRELYLEALLCATRMLNYNYSLQNRSTWDILRAERLENIIEFCKHKILQK